MNPRRRDPPEDPSRPTLTPADFDAIRDIVRDATETGMDPLAARVGALERSVAKFGDEIAGLAWRVEKRSDEIRGSLRSSERHVVLIAEHMGLRNSRP